MIVGTAGHIDHGKSALIEALTGHGMDPLVEERRRGITIDLHFTSLILPEGHVAGIVDVPGHEDLVRTMVAGAAGMDLVLLVIAADEGIMPQTREHLAVVEQLRVRTGIPVLTKIDLVDPDWLTMVTSEVSIWLEKSPVAFGPPVAVSARTGVGLDELRQRITAQAAAQIPRGAEDLARLPIDRAFSLPGAGTVVTGTASSGRFSVGDSVRVLPGEQRARIRSLERHGEAIARSAPGERLAVALVGVDRAELERGQVLVQDGDPWEPSRVLDVSLELLPGARRPLRHQSRVRVHLGTLEVMARVHLKTPLVPGASGPARLVLEAAAIARGGDRLVLRSYSPVEVIGGGWVVDPSPPSGAAKWSEKLLSDQLPERLAALLGRRPRGMPVAEAPVLLGAPPSVVAEVLADQPIELVHSTLVLRDRLQEAERLALGAVSEHHRTHPADPGISLETLRQSLDRFGAAGPAAIQRLVEMGELVVDRGAVRGREFRPASAPSEALVERLVSLIEAAGLAPPTIAEITAQNRDSGVVEALRAAAGSGRLVAIEGDRYFATKALETFTAALSMAARQGAITPAALRDATGITRKFLIPLLEWSDRAGLTMWRGDLRVAGPKLGSGSPT